MLKLLHDFNLLVNIFLKEGFFLYLCLADHLYCELLIPATCID